MISKKVEKVIGRKPKTSNVSSAEALTSILENWVSQEEEKGKSEEEELEDLIEKQTEQIKGWIKTMTFCIFIYCT